MMFQRYRNTSGETYAVRVWRIVLYVDRGKPESLRYGGIMCNWKGGREVAHHWHGRISVLGVRVRPGKADPNPKQRVILDPVGETTIPREDIRRAVDLFVGGRCYHRAGPDGRCVGCGARVPPGPPATLPPPNPQVA